MLCPFVPEDALDNLFLHDISPGLCLQLGPSPVVTYMAVLRDTAVMEASGAGREQAAVVMEAEHEAVEGRQKWVDPE